MKKLTLEVYNLDEISKYQLKKQQQFHTLNEIQHQNAWHITHIANLNGCFLQHHLDQRVYYAYYILYASSIYGFRVFKTTSYLSCAPFFIHCLYIKQAKNNPNTLLSS